MSVSGVVRPNASLRIDSPRREDGRTRGFSLEENVGPILMIQNWD